MKEIEITMKIEYDGYHCFATNTYEYKNEKDLKTILIREYFKVLELRYLPLDINGFIGYGSKNKITEYTYEDFINDLITTYFKVSDENGDLYFLILEKMENSKSIEEFRNYIRGLGVGLLFNEGDE